MGIDLFEDIVATCLQNEGYFIMNNVKCGSKEIDILAIKPRAKEVIHIEVSCSSVNVGYIGGKGKNFKELANNYIDKKYCDERVKKKIKDITGIKDEKKIKCWFVHGSVKEPKQLEVFKDRKIGTIHINEIIEKIIKKGLRGFSSNRRIKQLFDIMTDKTKSDKCAPVLYTPNQNIKDQPFPEINL